MSRGSYILGFLHPGVLMFRDSYVQESLCPRILYNVQGLLCPGVISFRGSNPFPGVLKYITLLMIYENKSYMNCRNEMKDFFAGFFMQLHKLSSLRRSFLHL